ncbi:MAG: hypothetical protein DRH51_05045 [Candidatus Coatesbacteria bacterium]|nr:MAG: hypothetical protein DRH51_05045 [Candidatus Coatesbacteria bacterium]RLC41925.1 MAG: hypothetical protein DRH44_06885 [Candidatus Coatesbacteria bacterium]
MATPKDIEGYLDKSGYDFETVDYGVWTINLPDLGKIAITHNEPLVVIRMKVADLPRKKGLEELYRKLLEMNSDEVVHGAFSIKGDSVILVDTLEDSKLDENELVASISSLEFAASRSIPVIKDYMGK